MNYTNLFFYLNTSYMVVVDFTNSEIKRVSITIVYVAHKIYNNMYSII